MAVKIARKDGIAALGFYTDRRLRSLIISLAIHIGRFCTRTLFWLFVVLAVLLSLLVLTLKYAALPRLQNYRGELVTYISQVTGKTVSADGMRTGWSGFRPYLELDNVQLLEPATSRSDLRPPGTVALRVPKMRATLSWWALLIGRWQFGEIRLSGPELALTRSQDGLIYFAGEPLNKPQATPDDGRVLKWLVEQPALRIEHAALTWQDDLTPGQELHFTEVGIALEKDGDRHRLGITATPPRSLAKRIEARGDMTLEQVNGRWQYEGTLYAALDDANLAELRMHVPRQEYLQSGYANVRAWAALDSIRNAGTSLAPQAITADVHLVNTEARWEADVTPIHIANLQGRLAWRQEIGGFHFGFNRLQLRTREGVSLPPADFSVTLTNQSDPVKAHGEISGNDIDLKVATALLEYFPVGKDIRAVAGKYAPHGVMRDTVFAWDGYLDKLPSHYRIKGVLDQFGLKPGDNTPGMDGFSGSVEGDQGGGKFNLASKKMAIFLPAYLRVPLQFDTLSGGGTWKAGAEAIEVDFDKITFENTGLNGALSGRYWRYRSDGPRAAEEKGPGSLELKGKLEHVDAKAVPDYLPNRIQITRRYLDRAVKGGQLRDVEVSLKGELYEFPFQHGKGGDWQIKTKLDNVQFDYLDKWPVADALNGDFSIANTKLLAVVESGRILKTKLNRTTVAVEDLLAIPAVLAIDGTADARAEEVMRYLHDSPLVEGVGAFTNFVGIEGAGRLELGLLLPLGPQGGSSKVNGKYSLNRAVAKPSFGPTVGSLTGTVAFTETNVKSTGLAGVAYDNPINISIAGGGPEPVTVDFLGRGELAKMGDVLPIALPQQVSGAADFKGRIATREGAVDINIDSDLMGVTSFLPAPLGKRAEEPRALSLQFKRAGRADEKIHMTLAAGAADKGKASLNSPVDARFQRRPDAQGTLKFFGGVASVNVPVAENAPLPEGIWLAGTMQVLDYDKWSDAYQAFYPASAGANAATGNSTLTGIDFKLDSLTAFGREFPAMTLKGRRNPDVWAMSVDSRDAVGDFTLRQGAGSDPGFIRARLKKLVLSDELPQAGVGPVAPTEPAKETHLPSLDIVADDFTLKERWLGKLELRGSPSADNYKIEQLIISNGHARLEMDGLWQRLGDAAEPGKASASRTNMNLKFEANNLNPLFEQFGFKDAMKGGTGKLEGKLSWPGHAYQFNLNNLSGNFRIEARNGQFSNAQIGASKLLGLLSLQSITRRLTFNFNDIFGKGLAFDKIDATVRVANGTMHTDDLVIDGPAAEVKFAGQVSLPEETQNLSMTVKPRVDSGIAIGVGLTTLGPAGALGAWIVQKIAGSPFEKILSVQYKVTGTWDEPVLTEVKADTVPVPTVPVPGTAATAPVAAPATTTNKDAPKKTP